MFEKLNAIAERLRDRGFDVAVFKNTEDATSVILSDIPEGLTVACGGSMTEHIDKAGGCGTGAFAMEAINFYCKK